MSLIALDTTPPAVRAAGFEGPRPTRRQAGWPRQHVHGCGRRGLSGCRRLRASVAGRRRSGVDRRVVLRPRDRDRGQHLRRCAGVDRVRRAAQSGRAAQLIELDLEHRCLLRQVRNEPGSGGPGRRKPKSGGAMSVIRKELGAFIARCGVAGGCARSRCARSGAMPMANDCATTLLSPAEMQQGIKSEVTCYRTHSEMLAARGISSRGLLGGSVLADHYVDAGGQGLHLTVFGASCDGGGLNLSAPFNNAISSTVHGLCGRIKHFSEANAGGDNQITTGGTANMNCGHERPHQLDLLLRLMSAPTLCGPPSSKVDFEGFRALLQDELGCELDGPGAGRASGRRPRVGLARVLRAPRVLRSVRTRRTGSTGGAQCARWPMPTTTSCNSARCRRTADRPAAEARRCKRRPSATSTICSSSTRPANTWFATACVA